MFQTKMKHQWPLLYIFINTIQAEALSLWIHHTLCSPVHHTDCFLPGRRVLPVFGIQRTLQCLQAVLRKLTLLCVRLQGAALEVSVNVGEYHLVTRGHNSNDEGQETPVGDIDATIGVCMWSPRERGVDRERERERESVTCLNHVRLLFELIL